MKTHKNLIFTFHTRDHQQEDLIGTDSGAFPSSELVHGVGDLALVVERQRLELLGAPAVVEAVYDLLALLVADVVEAGEAGPVHRLYLVVGHQEVLLCSGVNTL